jgi:sec-independent protein translocase protein TatB
MFDIGWTELMVIGIVALIVIGPKDLPEMFRTLGRFTAKAKGMAREFSRAMDSAADESGVKDMAADLRKATSAKSMGLDAVKDAASKFEAWDPLKSTKTAAPKVDPSAPKPVIAKTEVLKAETTKGPATQALAAAQAAKRAELAAPAVPQDAPAAKPKAARKAAPKAKDAAVSDKPQSKKPSPKKPSVKKSDA